MQFFGRSEKGEVNNPAVRSSPYHTLYDLTVVFSESREVSEIAVKVVRRED